MTWLTSLLKKPGAEQADPALIEPELPIEPPAPAPTGPQMAVLVPDMAGISSFRLRTMPDAASAGQHIASLRAEVRHETHAFWALHDRPIVDESVHVEALVLIRAQTDSDLVYVVSFLDLESALSFTRFEVRRGLYLGNVMIYWAAFTQLREELDGVSIHPDFAPPTTDYVLPASAPEQPRAAQPADSVEVAEPEREIATAPAPETTVEAEARQAVERYLREQKDEPPAPTVTNSAALAGPPTVEPVAELAADDEELGPMWPEANATVTQEVAPEPEAELVSPVAEEQAAIEEAFVFQHRKVEFRPLARPSALETVGEANGLLVDHEIEQAQSHRELAAFGAKAGLTIGEPEPVIETIPGDEEAEAGQFVPLGSLEAAGVAQGQKLDDFDVAYEVERLLRHRKWEQRNGPFSGFQSPPGRF